MISRKCPGTGAIIAFIVVLSQFNQITAKPLPYQKLTDVRSDARSDARTDDVSQEGPTGTTVIFRKPCDCPGKYEVLVGFGNSQCVNVNLSDDYTSIHIQPRGPILHLFEQPNCSGEPTVVDSGVENEVKVSGKSSFKIVR